MSTRATIKPTESPGVDLAAEERTPPAGVEEPGPDTLPTDSQAPGGTPFLPLPGTRELPMPGVEQGRIVGQLERIPASERRGFWAVIIEGSLPLNSSRRDELIESLAHRIAGWGMVAPAVFLLEAHRPLRFLASQALLLAEPLVGRRVRDYALLLEDRESVERILERLEALR